MFDLNDISQWKKSLGLLPIKLFSNIENKSDFILLDGGTGDFCIDIKPEISDKDYFSSSWSSNTKNFVSVKEKILELYNWKKSKIESISSQVVKDNYLKFYSYLISNSIDSEYDIVPFILNIFRKLRNLTNEKERGTVSLNLLFLLLASYEEQNPFNTIDRAKWGLSDFENPNNEFDNYLDEFSKGISVNQDLKPNIELILRHSSGALFQEAQKEALIFDKSLDLFSGTLSSIYNTRKILYSSIHYTPAYLARTIVENALNKVDLKIKETLKIFDPACGTSEFLMEALKQLKTRNYDGNVQVIGWDSSESAINTSRFILTYEKREWLDKLSVNLELVEDSLQKDWDNDYDIVLMNPPFVSWEQMSKIARESVRDALGATFNKRPNQASAFLYKAINSLKAESVIGSVVPSSILTLDSYDKLRNLIKDTISPSLIGKLGNYVFENALTDISIIIGQNPKTDESPLVLWTRNEKGIVTDALVDLRKLQCGNVPFIDEKDYSIYTPVTFPINNENWKPLSYQENQLFKKLEIFVLNGRLTRIQNIFSVRQGIRTGNNQVFKVKASFFYNSIPMDEKKYFRPVIDNESIKNGILLNKNYVWYPYDKDGLMIRNEDELQKEVPFFYDAILRQHKEQLLNRARKDINNWWVLSEHRAWLTTKYPKLSSTEFGKPGSFAFDKKGEYVIERGNGWIPKKDFQNTADYYFYLAIFSSSFFENLLSIYSKQLAGGQWYDLGKKYTKNIPIPKISEELRYSFVYDKLAIIGKEISESNIYDFKIIDNHLKESIYSL